jgi:hypothetical protein
MTEVKSILDYIVPIASVTAAVISAVNAIILFKMGNKNTSKQRVNDVYLNHKLIAAKEFLWQAERAVLYYKENDCDHKLGLQTTYDQFAMLFGDECDNESEKCFRDVVALLENPEVNDTTAAVNSISTLRNSVKKNYKRIAL